MSVPQFIYPFYYWWNFRLFLVWDIKNNAAKNIIVYVSWCSLFMSFYKTYIPQRGISIACVSSFLLEKGQMLSEDIYIFLTNLDFYWKGMRVTVSQFSKTYLISRLPYQTIRRVVSVFNCGLFCVSLIIIEIKHLSMYFFTTWVFFLWSIYMILY